MCLVERHENKSDLFYSTQEINIIKQRRVRDCHNLMECNILWQDLVTMLEKDVANTSVAIVGLERILSKWTYIQTIQHQRASVEAVLREQHRQLSLGVYDPNTLANISVARTSWAQERARTIGLLHSNLTSTSE
jgi:hypothetical protein